jgi:molecular chaperone GrpE
MPETDPPQPVPADPAMDPSSDPAGDPVAALREALARADATAADNWNRYLRAVADLENARKRAARDVEAARRSGVEKLATELLAALDSLEMGLSAAGATSVENLIAGKEATLRQLRAALDKFSIEAVDPVGQPFDPQLHEAMSMQPSREVRPGSVLLVLQKGYRIGDRLLRPARVIVAGEPVSSGTTRTGDEPGTGDGGADGSDGGAGP